MLRFKGLWTLFFVFFLISLCSCNFQNTFKKDFDYGVVKDSVYVNNYFNLEIKINPNWYVLSNEEVDSFFKQDRFKKDENFKPSDFFKKKEVKGAGLFSMSKYDINEAYNTNPSFTVYCENISSNKRIKAKDYLLGFIRSLQETEFQYTIPNDIYSTEIDNKPFDVLEIEYEVNGFKTYQEHFASIIEDYALVFTTTYIFDFEKEELYKSFKNIKFK